MPYLSKLTPLLYLSSLLLLTLLGTSHKTLANKTVETFVEINQRYTEMNASWNTGAGNTGIGIPNINSELSFNNAVATPLEIRSEVKFNTFGPLLLVGFEALNGDFNNGHVIDSDYLGDNRTDEFSRSRSEITGDKINNVKAYFGWQDLNKAYNLSILVGYQSSEQSFRMQNGDQLIGTASLEGLNSVYSMQWQGPWIGGRWAETKGRHRVTVAYDYHFANSYNGEAEWNLRTDLKQPLSFEHEADAQGHELQLDYTLKFSTDWRFKIFYEYAQWESKAGAATRYFSNGLITEIQLNKAESESRSYGIGLQYRF